MEAWELVIKAVAALGGVGGLLGAVLAIAQRVRPKLTLSLLETDSEGEDTIFGRGSEAPPAYFYHLIVRNRRNKQAKNVWVKLKTVSKPDAAGTFHNTLSRHLPLKWPGRDQPSPLDIAGLSEATCNLGYIGKHLNYFQLDPYDWPPNFQGIVKADERLRVEVAAEADNARSNTLCIEVYWDGTWIDHSSKDMKHHLIIKAESRRA